MGRARSRSRSRSDPIPCCCGSELDFHGGRVNVIQVGLGNNATFLQNLGGSDDEWDFNTHKMLQSVSELRPELITGIGVEPVREYIAQLTKHTQKFQHVALVQAALGERETSGEEVFVFTQTLCQEFLKNHVPDPDTQKYVEKEFQYLMNMSSIGSKHPELSDKLSRITSNIGQASSAILTPELRHTDVWTWERLAKTLNFGGCELLLIDAEGYDAQILRSMISHCKREEQHSPGVWPDVIQLETMGLCDRRDGSGTEWEICNALQREGYVLLYYSHYNTRLAREKLVYERHSRVSYWAERHFRCADCQSFFAFPYASYDGNIFCKWCRCEKISDPADLSDISEALRQTLSNPTLTWMRGDGYALLEEVIASARIGLQNDVVKVCDDNVVPDGGFSLNASVLRTIRQLAKTPSLPENDSPCFQLWEREDDDCWIRLVR